MLQKRPRSNWKQKKRNESKNWFARGNYGGEIQKREKIKWGRNAKGESLAGCTEALNLYSPQIIYEIYTSYLQAGANIITSNTFGAMEWVLAE